MQFLQYTKTVLMFESGYESNKAQLANASRQLDATIYYYLLVGIT